MNSWDVGEDRKSSVGSGREQRRGVMKGEMLQQTCLGVAKQGTAWTLGEFKLGDKS
jgi:hypothetical protein